MPRVYFLSDESAADSLEPALPAGTVVDRNPRRLRVVPALFGRWRPPPTDWVHAEGMRAIAVVGCELWGWRAAGPWIASTSSWLSGSRLEQGLAEKWLHRAALVIARTEEDVWLLSKLRKPAARVCRVPLAAAPPAAADPAAVRRTLGVPPDARLIVAAGRLEVASDLAVAVWAFNGLRYTVPDVYLVIAGVGPERHRLERFARDAAPEDHRVRFVADRAGVIAVAEQVWVPHRLTGGGQAALDAMAAGVPVLAADIPDLREIVGDAGLFFPPGDRGRLCELAYRLLQDPPAARALGEAGRRRAIEHFPPSALADALAAVYYEAGVPPAR